MNSSNLPILEKKGFINKIKQFFRNLFFKNKSNKVEAQEEIVTKTDNKEYKAGFINDIKADIDYNNMKKENERDELFTKIRNHPELLESLSNEQLERLSDFYENKIEINNNIIQEKKEKIEKLKKAG